VARYVLAICRQLGIDEAHLEAIQLAALLHDYGKIGVPDAVLKKPGRLSREEFEVIKSHSQTTGEILSQMAFEGTLECVPDIAACHHERMDGSGYPCGLKGDAIPLGARIIAVADCFEALTAVRCYRQPMSMREAMAVLRENSGSQFDPRVVDAFMDWLEQRRQVEARAS
jgi:HD-GYP domain-containing protein (c-di-GMP phosphodiesterase class II)